MLLDRASSTRLLRVVLPDSADGVRAHPRPMKVSRQFPSCTIHGWRVRRLNAVAVYMNIRRAVRVNTTRVGHIAHNVLGIDFLLPDFARVRTRSAIVEFAPFLGVMQNFAHTELRRRMNVT